MKKFILGLGSVALALMLVVPAIAETQDTVKSNVMGFAKKKTVEEVVIPEDVVVPAEQEAYEEPSVEKTVYKPTVTAKAMPVAAPVTAPAATINATEAQTKLQAIKTQEQWVGKLTKQLEGETKQLKEMRESYAQAFGKEPK